MTLGIVVTCKTRTAEKETKSAKAHTHEHKQTTVKKTLTRTINLQPPHAPTARLKNFGKCHLIRITFPPKISDVKLLRLIWWDYIAFK
jgi:hypothetical protein